MRKIDKPIPEQAHTYANSKKSRIVLINRRTLITLAGVTLTLLWLLQPNKDLLVRMMENAQDPNIAIAFLEVLQDDNSPSLKLDLVLAKQYANLTNYQQAITELEPLSRFMGSEFEAPAKLLYATSLLQLSFKGEQSSTAQLKQFLHNEIKVQPSANAEQFASYALQIGQPKLAYQLLSQQNTKNHTQLADLALQANFNQRAIQHLKQDFQQQPTTEQFVTLVSLFASEQNWQAGTHFIEYNITKVDCQLGCLQTLINFMLSANLPEKSVNYALKKALQSSDTSDWLQASQLFAANGNTQAAATWLAKVVKQQPSFTHIKQLHDYQLWLGKPGKALELTKLMLQKSTDPTILRQGLAEAATESDVLALSDFYYQLALQNQLSDQQKTQWLDYNDKAYGAEQTLVRLQSLYQRYPEQAYYWFALARIYNFIGEQDKIIQLWQQLNLDSTLNYQEAEYFAQAYLALGQPDKALALFKKHTPLSSLNLNQLATLDSLAKYVGDNKVQRLIQELRVTRKDRTIDPYALLSSYKVNNEADLKLLWQYYLDSGSLVVLSHILNYAINANNTLLIKQIEHNIEQNLKQNMSLDVQLLRLSLATYHQDVIQAKQLLVKLHTQYPDNQQIIESSFWLAISTEDKKWLSKLYWQLVPNLQHNSTFFQLLAYAAQLLGLSEQAQLWYQRLDESEYASAANKLAWALLLEQQGNEEQAQILRWYVLTILAEQLKQLPQGELSYQALLSLFVSPAYVATKQQLALQQAYQQDSVTPFSELYTDVTSVGLQRLAYWQAHSVIERTNFNDSIQLAIALAYNDDKKIKAITSASSSLTPLERATALSKIGQNFSAWQTAEHSLHAGTIKQQIAPLQRFLANAHNLHSHGVRFEHTNYDSWQINTEQLSYYQPIYNGLFRLDYQLEHGTAASTIVDNYNRDLLQLNWKTRNWTAFSGLEFSLSMSDRFEQTIFGQQLKLNWQSSPRISQQVELRNNMPSKQSQSLYLLGYEDRLQWRGAWQVNRYEQVSLTVSAAEFNSDFSDYIGQQLQTSLRLSEQLSLHPNWQLYSQFDYHKNNLSTQPLSVISTYFPSKAINAADFISQDYRRLTLGQTIIHGNVGEPGPDDKPPRFSLDTALGYNLLTSELDYSINFSVGIPLFGSDELFFKTAWQSADQNGQKNLSWNLGYFIDF